ncbi:metalloenzyme superfamily-domain-containing protein [Mycena galopus ATCC 62051]|nr:metalloenzyme superfamily-domain-containing protein [Mycena galopus ATCC 62051]
MSVQAVADKVAELPEKGKDEFVMCNFAPPDMVGHTGDFDVAVRAISATDAVVGTMYAACLRAGYVLLVTADHGNAEQMRDPNDTKIVWTAHTCNKVPFILASGGGKEKEKEKYGFKDDADAKGEKEEKSRGRCAMSRRRFWILWSAFFLSI